MSLFLDKTAFNKGILVSDTPSEVCVPQEGAHGGNSEKIK